MITTKTKTNKIHLLAFLFLCVSLSTLSLDAQRRPEIAPTPPMGWNSWNWFGPKITEKEVVGIIDAMVEKGLRDAGYTYIVIDGGWREDFLDADGKLLPSADRFPRGMKWLSEYAHSKGFKFGLHSVPGRFDCRGNEMGSFGREEIHLAQFLEWKLDFLKLDQCRLQKTRTAPGPAGWGWTPDNVRELYTKWSKLLRDSGRDIVFSASNYSFHDWYPELTNMGRTTGDIKCRWTGGAEFDKGDNPRLVRFYSIMEIADINNAYARHAGNGYWNDPDMMVTGHRELTDEEQKAHMALWCVMTSPLFLGNDPRKMTPQELALLTNKELIAVNQDPTEQGVRISAENGAEVWMKKLRNGDYALLLLNRKRAPGEIVVDFAKLGLPKKMYVRDLYNKKDLGRMEKINAKFPDRGSMFVRVSRNK